MPDFTLRTYRGPEDIPAILAALRRSWAADALDWATTEEELRSQLAYRAGWELETDLVLADADGEVIGVARPAASFIREGPDTCAFHECHVVPEWRGRGVGRRLLAAIQRRLVSRLVETDQPGEWRFMSELDERQRPAIRLLEADGYAVRRAEYDMLRSLAEPIADLPLPDGVEVRPVPPDRLGDVLEASYEAFRDMPMWWPNDDAAAMAARRRSDLDDPVRSDPELWVVAWHGDVVVGSVRGWIDAAENAAFNRRRGYTERISVRREWRGRGVASAMIVRHLALLRDAGMAESGLGVDTENPSGALRIYEQLGYRRVRTLPILARSVRPDEIAAVAGSQAPRQALPPPGAGPVTPEAPRTV